MKLIQTTRKPPASSVPRLRPRRSGRRIALVIWMTALTILVALVLAVFSHTAQTIQQTLAGLSS